MVDFFFVLSGFIITHVYQHYFKDGFKWSVFKKFMIARFARLYPLHLATLLFMIGIYVIMQTTGIFDSLYTGMQLAFEPNAILSNLLLVQSWGIHPEPTWNAPSWSISVEWWTYILFPFFIFFLAKTGRWAKWLTTVVAIGGYLAIMYYFQPAQFEARQAYLEGVSEMPNTIDVMVGSGLLRCICGFLLGMVVYLAFENRQGESWLSNSTLMITTWILMFVGWHFNLIPDVVSAVIFGLMILMAAYNNGFGKRLLNVRWLQFLGDISYSTYMVHMPIIFCYYTLRGLYKSWTTDPNVGMVVETSQEILVNQEPHPPSFLVVWGGLVIFLLGTIVCAYLTYTYIEKPMRNVLKQKLSGKPKKVVA